MIAICIAAAPASAMASALCCDPVDACCSEPCAASECTTVPDDHCALGTAGPGEFTGAAPPDLSPAIENHQRTQAAAFPALAPFVPGAAPSRPARLYILLSALRN